MVISYLVLLVLVLGYGIESNLRHLFLLKALVLYLIIILVCLFGLPLGFPLCLISYLYHVYLTFLLHILCILLISYFSSSTWKLNLLHFLFQPSTG